MNNTQAMQKIKQDIMKEQDCTNDQAVRYIADLLSRSRLTVYDWLSINRPEIPDQLLELLRLKL